MEIVTMKLLTVLPVLILMACNNARTTQPVEQRRDNSKHQLTDTLKPSANKIEHNISSDDLIGAWTDGGTENATFNIQKNSIFYVDQLTAYKYSLNGDSIKIFYPDWVFSGAVRLTKDTLVIVSEDGTTKYWRFKN